MLARDTQPLLGKAHLPSLWHAERVKAKQPLPLIILLPLIDGFTVTDPHFAANVFIPKTRVCCTIAVPCTSMVAHP